MAVVLVFRPAVALTAAEDDQRRQAAAEVGAEEGGAGQSGRERAEAEARGTGSIRELSGAVLLAVDCIHFLHTYVCTFSLMGEQGEGVVFSRPLTPKGPGLSV